MLSPCGLGEAWKCCQARRGSTRLISGQSEADDPLRDTEESAEEPRGRLSEIHELPENDTDRDAGREPTWP
jgi:hypothetical protein